MRWHACCDTQGLNASADETRPTATGDGPMNTTGDLDPGETSEWIDALSAVQQHRGSERAGYLINRLVDEGRREGVYVPCSLNTAYCNTIPPEREEKSSGDRAIEHRLRSIIRWNAMAIILCANKDSSELGGHIASIPSYPHPWLMPDFWQFPTVSMGLGPLMAIYQARFLKYLHGRGLADTAKR